MHNLKWSTQTSSPQAYQVLTAEQKTKLAQSWPSTSSGSRTHAATSRDAGDSSEPITESRGRGRDGGVVPPPVVSQLHRDKKGGEVIGHNAVSPTRSCRRDRQEMAAAWIGQSNAGCRRSNRRSTDVRLTSLGRLYAVQESWTSTKFDRQGGMSEAREGRGEGQQWMVSYEFYEVDLYSYLIDSTVSFLGVGWCCCWRRRREPFVQRSRPRNSPLARACGETEACAGRISSTGSTCCPKACVPCFPT